jgi:uncharacterized alpha-E superfamily protein
VTLLARTAGQLYWAARYLERAEGVSRVVREHTHLLADMPASELVSWRHLLEIGGDPAAFARAFVRVDEAGVVTFLVSSPENPTCISACIERARENLRGCREIIPTEAWTVVNDLHLYLSQHADEAVGRRTRGVICDRVIAEHQRFLGILLGSMTRDSAFLFMRLGRHLERAALTTRMLAAMQDDEIDRAYADVRWIGLLRALAALHMYHRSVGEPVSGPSAMRFLLFEASFPRSVGFCLDSALGIVGQLPMSGRIADAQDGWRARLEIRAWEASNAGGLHASIGDLADTAADISDAVVATYFLDGIHDRSRAAS